MNLYVSRNGQTFGPYTSEQAKTFLDAKQLLETDFALVEGSSEWKLLPEILIQCQKDNTATLAVADTLESKENQPTSVDRAAVSHASDVKQAVKSKSSRSSPKKTSPKVQKLKKAKGGKIIMIAQEKSFISKLFSTIFVFVFLLLLAIGGIVGVYFAMPTKMSPILARFGLDLEKFGVEGQLSEPSSETKSPDEIILSEDAWNTLRSSGIRILPMVSEKGLQVISSVDPDLAMKDEDLEKLLIIAPHIISLDLTDSKVTNSGIDHIMKMPNLKKLFLEGAALVDSSGIAKLKSSQSLEYLNLIRVKLEPPVIDSLIGLESLREVYLFDSGLGETEISRLKTSRPKIFVNSG